ncbi:hypothetical protein GCM10011585_17540 [Edaphobacter dinghuensis]|uniref:Uncharacterized protein n=1 Tax=Edaphobacter dinghuensis TaxID=1560005 RepID=A0A917M4P1_9BACT|nr:hypothetical protein GCM10011585_17540 [Edaphobacter dinghuensis]
MGNTQKRARYGREEVGMFMSIEMSDRDAGLLQLLDLRKGFAFDLLFADVAAHECLHEVEQG